MTQRLLRVALPVLLALLCPVPADADERILSYDSEVDIRADGSLDVVEHIHVRAEGSNIRRGIYRDFPTRYRDRHGNRVVVGFEVVGVKRDGRTERWFSENLANGVRVNTGETISCRYRRNTPTPCATAPRASSDSSPTTTSCTGTRSATAGCFRSTPPASKCGCRARYRSPP